jgi:hypothetical protein
MTPRKFRQSAMQNVVGLLVHAPTQLSTSSLFHVLAYFVMVVILFDLYDWWLVIIQRYRIKYRIYVTSTEIGDYLRTMK